MKRYLTVIVVWLPMAVLAQKKIIPEQVRDSIRFLVALSEEKLKTHTAEAEKLAKQAHSLALQIDNEEEKAKCTFLLGKIYFFAHKDELSLQAFNHSSHLFLLLGDSTNAALALNGAGNVYLQKMKNFTEALNHYNQAVALLKNDSATSIRVLNNIGTIYNRTGKYTEALEVYKRVYSVAQRNKDLQNMSASLNNIGSAYDHLKDFASSIDYLKKAIEIKEAYGDDAGITNTLTNLGIAYGQLKKFDDAERVLNRARLMARENGLPDIEIYTNLVLSGHFADQGHLKDAISHAEEAYALSRKTGVTFHNGSIFKKLSEMYRLNNQLDKALTFQQKYAAFNDSLTRVERNAVADMVVAKAAEPKRTSPSDSFWFWLVVANVMLIGIATSFAVILHKRKIAAMKTDQDQMLNL